MEVVNPGRRGGAAGPDFRDAVVLLDGVERRGDVELHVVYLADEPETRLQDGGVAPVAAFAPWLQGRAGELQSWLRAPEIWRPPCRDATARLGQAAVRRALEDGGLRRFEARLERMAAEVERLGPEEALWRALLDTLGVGGDREGFRRLAAAFPASLATRVADLEPALLYVAGLGPEPAAGESLPRPLRPGLRSPVEQCGGRLEESPGAPLSEMALASLLDTKRTKPVLAMWTAPPQIGAARAQELLVNAVLPFAAALGLKKAAVALLRTLLAGTSYGKTGFLESNLRPTKGRIARSALQSQGLLGYVTQWCSQGGCGKCPLSRADDQTGVRAL